MDFKQPYNHQTLLHFLQHNFLPDDFEILEEDIDINFKTQFIKKVVFLGKVNSLGLNVYEAYHHSENDPRVSLSSEIFRLLADYGVGRALVIFISSKSPNYRFSLVTIDLKWEKGKQIKKEYSNPRRYSFYLGPDAKVHTPYQFLVNKGKIKNLDDLFLRFNVEVVTKEFFSKYRLLFEKLLNYLIKDNAFKIFAQKNNISIENFAKKLLGQIVFIYFLQRKGWLGAGRENKINEGNKDFLRHLFNKSKLEGKNFFNSYLEPLFYNALNSKSKYAANFYRDYFDCQIPFLNGGLFEPLNNYDWENAFISLPDKLFSSNPKHPEKGEGILDIFDLYNFTVAEDDPVDKEVSIDPEMLGKVFENLLEENLRKGKGTYYTPREIVHYMCRESLINYLATEVNLIPEDVRNKYFPPYNVLGDKKFEARDVSVSEKIIESLKNIKIVDPACGSGAFLVGMLQQITQLRHELEMRSKLLGRRKLTSTEYETKKETIQNCIYGVDIDPGAVEIAKLRLWLSLVVDYGLDQVEPLPNLDYKIMVGNSLIDKAIINGNLIEIFNPADLEEFKDNKKFKNLFEEDLQGDIYSWSVKGEINSLVKKFIETKDLLFKESDFEKKLNLKNKINQLENEIIRVSLKKESQKVKDQLTNKNLSPSEKIHLEFTKKFLQDLVESNKELDKYKHENIFLWYLNFIEVFKEKGGFDVIIANPPYVSAVTMARNDSQKEYFKKIYPLAIGSYDIYILFLLKAMELLNKIGVYTWIIPNKFLIADYAKKCKELLIKKNGLINSIDVSSFKVFKETGVYPIIIVGRRGFNKEYKELSIDKYEDLGLRLFKETKELRQHKTFKKFGIKLYSGTTGFQARQIIPFIKLKKTKNSIPFIVSGGVDRYYWSNKNVRYMGNSYNTAFIEKNSFIADSKWKFWNNPKIIIAGMTKVIESVYSLEPVALGVGIYGIYDFAGLEPKCLNGLLNSKYITFYFRQKFKDKHLAGGYLGINKSTIEELPLVDIEKTEQIKISDIVDKILAITKSSDYLENPAKKEEVKEYEKQINQLVYKLYGLTAEEIAIIEKSTSS